MRLPPRRDGVCFEKKVTNPGSLLSHPRIGILSRTAAPFSRNKPPTPHSPSVSVAISITSQSSQYLSPSIDTRPASPRDTRSLQRVNLILLDQIVLFVLFALRREKPSQPACAHLPQLPNYDNTGPSLTRLYLPCDALLFLIQSR